MFWEHSSDVHNPTFFLRSSCLHLFLLRPQLLSGVSFGVGSFLVIYYFNHCLWWDKQVRFNNHFHVISVSVCVAVSVSQKPELDYINFSWNKMTAAEFEHQWKEKKTNKKADFIHLIQVVASFHPSVVLIQSYSLDGCVLKTTCSD